MRASRIIPLVLVVFASQIMAGETKNSSSYERGLASIKSNEWKEAIINFTEAIHHNSKNALAYEYRGGAYVATGDLDNAINDFTQAIQLDSTNSRAYCNRGSVYRGKREFDKALTDLNKSLRLNPTNDAAYKTRAAIHGSKAEWYEAINDWDQGLRLNPNDSLNALALASRGWAHFMTSQFDKALHDYRDALQLNPTNDSALNNLAWLRATCPSAEMRNGKEAVKLATKACELTNWEQWDWIDTLAAAFAEAGDFRSAVKYEKQAMDMSSVTESYRKEMQRCLLLYEQQRPNHEGQKQ